MEQEQLVNELVQAQVPVPESPKIPKRNSKDEIIDKILSLSERIGEPVEESNSQLKRMSKNKLMEKLGQIIEKQVEFEATKVLGINKDQAQSPYLVNMAALKMVHDISCNTVESLVERTSNTHGMTLKGFAMRMKESQENVDAILHELCQMYPNVLEKISSPWIRLSLLWGSNVVVSLKKKPVIKNAPDVRSQQNQRVHTV